MNTEDAQKVLKWVRITLIVLAIFLAAEALVSLKNLRNISPTYNSISVSGVGEAVSLPDVATFSFTVSGDAKTVSDAQGQVTGKMDAILAGLEALGIEEKDIETTGYNSFPTYEYSGTVCIQSYPSYCPPGKQVLTGYEVSHTISVKVRKTEDVGKAFAIVGDNGATGLSGISFTVDDPDKILDEARAEAITNAEKKAKMLAKELGVRLVRVVSFYDNSGGITPYYAEGFGGDMVKSSAPAPTIPAGENKVNVSVTIVYEIR
ncbi:MAG: SIMPL domain-containing protein [bacterium]|nr:SIMPL domain-containing protein [bacterium]